ncbi:hypothetical protein PRIPAC_84902 [Pristionchus pacificus]|uniref:Dehydrogenase n=1 Tax=Pristionchus pacificus TaxID=54126 RepID=A0A2A6BSF2_PRIPA|nr:hypothetical protein PRIPAC_84902 [Pristionchus pacificus]|eukprot:PDM68807.1 dehydrogenase [Pristionchus pacificus]
MLVAIVTGASSGIGEGTALLFAERGYAVSITGRNEAALNSVKEQALKKGAKEENILITVGDIADKAFAEKLVKDTVAKFGQIDTLVNSAGIIVNGAVIDCPLEKFDDVFNVNVRSLIQLSQLALPHIIQSTGTVVNVSSIAGPCPFPGVAYYCMSKAAVDQFTKCLALEMAPHGVRVNAVCPGVIVTDIHKRGGMSEQQYAEFLEKCKSTHALGRPGEVAEVAKAILFLAGPDSSFTTGDLLKIDGGRGIMHPR